MKIIGVIAEYNPFHNGHAYQLQMIRETLHPDAIVVVMSGNFVQRGEPALLDKHKRAQMALQNGADLVLELPVLYATASAEIFAYGAVSLLHSLGCIDSLVFGAEDDALPLLSQIAKILSNEPKDYKDLLQAYLKEGFSFPMASSKALTRLLSDDTISTILEKPNNILALQYLKALYQLHSTIKPVLIKRIGNHYHDTNLSDEVMYGSASGIRNLLSEFLFENKEVLVQSDLAATNSFNRNLFCVPSTATELANTLKMPESAASLLLEAVQNREIVFPNDLSLPLHNKLIYDSFKGFTQYLDITDEISDKIYKYLPQFQSFSQFKELLKSKNLTSTRISRCILHIYVSITKELWSNLAQNEYVPYIRPLGFTTAGKNILSTCKETAHAPLLSKLSRAETTILEHSLAPQAGLELFHTDLIANGLYDSLLTAHSGKPCKNERTKQLIILPNNLTD